jgi:hypothetical protein
VQWNEAQEYEEVLTGHEVDAYDDVCGFIHTGHTARFYRAFLIECIQDDIEKIKELMPSLTRRIDNMMDKEIEHERSNCGEIPNFKNKFKTKRNK